MIHLSGGDHNTYYPIYDQALGAQGQLAFTLEQKHIGVWITPDMSSSLQRSLSQNCKQLLGKLKCNFKNGLPSTFTSLCKN